MILQPLKLLIVDDDLSWQRIYRFYLENQNLWLKTATDKDDALQIIKQETFDIAVIDLRLVADDDSNFDGVDVAKQIKQTSPMTRIVIKSGFTDDAKVTSELEKLKPDGIFDKGKPIEEFVNAVLTIVHSLSSQKAKENHEQ